MMLARLGSLRAMRPLGRAAVLRQIPCATRTPPSLLVLARGYNEFNRIEDMLGAAEAWHVASALPKIFGQSDLSEASLRQAFDRIDLNGNGVIEAYELKAAILAVHAEVADSTVARLSHVSARLAAPHSSRSARFLRTDACREPTAGGRDDHVGVHQDAERRHRLRGVRAHHAC